MSHSPVILNDKGHPMMTLILLKIFMVTTLSSLVVAAQVCGYGFQGWAMRTKLGRTCATLLTRIMIGLSAIVSVMGS